MFYIIYEITNTINEKIYIGKHKTKNIQDKYFGSGKLLKKAIAKHGKEHFKKEILFVFKTEREMNEKEREIVNEEFCKRDNTYNICTGGSGGFSYINQNRSFYEALKDRKAIDEKKRKTTIGRKNPLATETLKRGHAEGTRPLPPSFLGKTHTEETKRKMRNKAVGKNIGEMNGQYGTKWITNGVESRKIQNTNVIPFGWQNGRIMKYMSR